MRNKMFQLKLGELKSQIYKKQNNKNYILS